MDGTEHAWSLERGFGGRMDAFFHGASSRTHRTEAMVINVEEQTEAEEGGPLVLANRGGVLLRDRPVSWSPLRSQTRSLRFKQLQESWGESAP